MNKARMDRAIEVIQSLIDRGLPETEHTFSHPEKSDDYFNISMWGKQTECGTVACLGGWFTLDPTFRAEGLRHHGDFRPANLMRLRPSFEKKSEIEALEEFFGLSYDQACHLFAGWNTKPDTAIKPFLTAYAVTHLGRAVDISDPEVAELEEALLRQVFKLGNAQIGVGTTWT